MESIAAYDDPLAMGTFKMPPLKAVCTQKSGSEKKMIEEDLDKLIATAGIVRLNADINEDFMEGDEEPSRSPDALLSAESLKKLRTDEKDFPELSFDLNKESNVVPK